MKITFMTIIALFLTILTCPAHADCPKLSGLPYFYEDESGNWVAGTWPSDFKCPEKKIPLSLQVAINIAAQQSHK